MADAIPLGLSASRSNLVGRFIVGFLFLVTMSATLVESYAYRYSGSALALIGFIHWLRARPRPAVDWQSWLCLGWGCYVIIRFTGQYALELNHPIGDRELLFSMTLAFPLIASALFQAWDDIERIIASYFAIALITLIATAHFSAIFAGETVRPLIQHNQIHGAVSCGIIMIAAIFWAIHYATTNCKSRFLAVFSFVAAPLIVTLCLVAIYGAKSKGVWLALALTLPVIGAATLRHLMRRKAIGAVIVCLLLLFCALYSVRDNISRTAGPTLFSTVSLLEAISNRQPLWQAVSGTIGDNGTPQSMNERLQLWHDAADMIAAAPLIGWGNDWPRPWKQSTYSPKYMLMHNGYLEILVRHGTLGAMLLALMLVSFVIAVCKASSECLVPRAGTNCYVIILFYFSLTLLSNSNNILAIGESLATLSAVFALTCNRKTTRPKPAFVLAVGATDSLSPY